MRSPSNTILAATAAAVVVVGGIAAHNYSLAQKPKKPTAKVQNKAIGPEPGPYRPESHRMRFARIVTQPQPDIIVVAIDLDLWVGKKAKPLPGNDGVRIDVGVYAPDDPECQGTRVAEFIGKPRYLAGMDVPVRDKALVAVDVPVSLRPYNVVVQLIGGNVFSGNMPTGIVSKDRAKLLPPVRPYIFGAMRCPAKLGF